MLTPMPALCAGPWGPCTVQVGIWTWQCPSFRSLHLLSPQVRSQRSKADNAWLLLQAASPPPWPMQSSGADGARTAQAWGSPDLSFCYPNKCQSSSSSYASAKSVCKSEQPLLNQVQ